MWRPVLMNYVLLKTASNTVSEPLFPVYTNEERSLGGGRNRSDTTVSGAFSRNPLARAV